MRSHLASFDRDALFTIDALTRHHVFGHQRILFATGDEDAIVPVALDDHLGTALHATSATALANTTTGSHATTASCDGGVPYVAPRREMVSDGTHRDHHGRHGHLDRQGVHDHRDRHARRVLGVVDTAAMWCVPSSGTGTHTVRAFVCRAHTSTSAW